MIAIDSRVGSKELHSLFPIGASELTQLEAGDFSFVGFSNGDPVLAGVERMTLRDFVNKVWSGRLYDSQLPKLLAAYNIIYILLEGAYRHDNGYVRLNSGKRLLGGQRKEVTYQQFQSMIWTLSYTVPAARILRTDDQRDTVCTLLSLEHWWQQDSASHTSHLKIYAPPPTLNGRQVHVTKLVHQVARQLPGIGDAKCFKVAAHFRSTKRMINATTTDWRQLEGVGRVTADRIVKQIEEEL